MVASNVLFQSVCSAKSTPTKLTYMILLLIMSTFMGLKTAVGDKHLTTRRTSMEVIKSNIFRQRDAVMLRFMINQIILGWEESLTWYANQSIGCHTVVFLGGGKNSKL